MLTRAHEGNVHFSAAVRTAVGMGIAAAVFFGGVAGPAMAQEAEPTAEPTSTAENAEPTPVISEELEAPAGEAVEPTEEEVAAPADESAEAVEDVGPVETTAPVEESTEASTTAAVPVLWEPLTVTTTVDGSYTAVYGWDGIAKRAFVESVGDGEEPVDGSTVTADSPVEVRYHVEGVEGDRDVSDVVVEGTISVTNPNDSAMTATVEDALTIAAVCSVAADDADPGTEGLQVSFESGTTELAYSCDPDVNEVDPVCQVDGPQPEPNSPCSIGDDLKPRGTHNEAVLTWSRADYPQEPSDADNPSSAPEGAAGDSAQIAWDVEGHDRTVHLSDDMNTDLSTTFTWTGDYSMTHEAVYTLMHEAPPGQCRDFVNTATLVNEKGEVLASDDVAIEVCNDSEPAASPESTPGAATDPSAGTSGDPSEPSIEVAGGTLPETGAGSGWTAAAGVLLIVLGTALVRRRKGSAAH